MRILFIFPLLLLCGCQAIGDVYTCTITDWHVSCGSITSTQDSPSSFVGVRDEKPDRTFPESPA